MCNLKKFSSGAICCFFAVGFRLLNAEVGSIYVGRHQSDSTGVVMVGSDQSSSLQELPLPSGVGQLEFVSADGINLFSGYQYPPFLGTVTNGVIQQITLDPRLSQISNFTINVKGNYGIVSGKSGPIDNSVIQYLDQSGVISTFTPPQQSELVSSVAVNASGVGIIVGKNLDRKPVLLQVQNDGNVGANQTFVPYPDSARVSLFAGLLESSPNKNYAIAVGRNDETNWGFITRYNLTNTLASFESFSYPPDLNFEAVSINNNGEAILCGQDAWESSNPSHPVAYFLDSTGTPTLTPITFSSTAYAPMASCAIGNDKALLGGYHRISPTDPITAVIYSYDITSGVLNPITYPDTGGATIAPLVAINTNDQGVYVLTLASASGPADMGIVAADNTVTLVPLTGINMQVTKLMAHSSGIGLVVGELDSSGTGTPGIFFNMANQVLYPIANGGQPNLTVRDATFDGTYAIMAGETASNNAYLAKAEFTTPVPTLQITNTTPIGADEFLRVGVNSSNSYATVIDGQRLVYSVNLSTGGFAPISVWPSGTMLDDVRVTSGPSFPILATSVQQTEPPFAYICASGGITQTIALGLFPATSGLINNAGDIVLVADPALGNLLSTGIAFVNNGTYTLSEVSIPPFAPGDAEFKGATILESGGVIMAQMDTNVDTSYIYYIPNGQLTPSDTHSQSDFYINSLAAVNTFGYYAGEDGNDANNFLYKFTIPILNPQLVSGFPAGEYGEPKVAMDSFGNAIVAATFNNGGPYSQKAFLIINDIITELTIPGNPEDIRFNAISAFLGSLPPGPGPGPIPNPDSGVSGANAALANYIFETNPQSMVYLLPSIVNGTINEALDSIAPSRNQVTPYTSASNQVGVSSTTFPSYLRNQQMVSGLGSNTSVGKLKGDQFVVALDPATQKRGNTSHKAGQRTAWVQGLGAFSYQRAQQQIPAFNTSTAGFVAGIDQMVTDQIRLGAGVTYLYTHLGQKGHQGFSNMNQEDLFVYGSWDNDQFYVDGSFLAGMFQIHQIRNILLTDFTFKATSDSHGWNADPHLETGYSYRFSDSKRDWWSYNSPFQVRSATS